LPLTKPLISTLPGKITYNTMYHSTSQSTMTMMMTIPNRLMNRQRNRGFDTSIIDGLGCVQVPLSDRSAGCLSSSNRSCSLSWTNSISLLLELDTETLPEGFKSLRRLNRYLPPLWPFLNGFPEQDSLLPPFMCFIREH
jgi:hypothetical protein